MPLRPDNVKPSMRKQRPTTPHRRPGFDALEDRHLLSAGFFGAPRVEEIVVVFAPSQAYDVRPAFDAPTGFQPESPILGGVAGWAAGGPLDHGWAGPEFARGDGPEWMASNADSSPVGSLPSTVGNSGSLPAATSPAPRDVVPPWDADSTTGPSPTGAPMPDGSNGSYYGSGPNPGPQPNLSLSRPWRANVSLQGRRRVGSGTFIERRTTARFCEFQPRPRPSGVERAWTVSIDLGRCSWWK